MTLKAYEVVIEALAMVGLLTLSSKLGIPAAVAHQHGQHRMLCVRLILAICFVTDESDGSRNCSR